MPFVTLLLLGSILTGCQRETADTVANESSQSAESTGTVTVEVEQANGVQTYQVPDVAAGSTVESVMRALDEADMVITGTGTNAFVHQIGEVATGGGEGWTYTIDGELADKGIGSTTIDPPVTIRWEFGGGLFEVE